MLSCAGSYLSDTQERLAKVEDKIYFGTRSTKVSQAILFSLQYEEGLVVKQNKIFLYCKKMFERKTNKLELEFKNAILL